MKRYFPRREEALTMKIREFRGVAAAVLLLVVAHSPGDVGAAPLSMAYTYDAIGRLTSATWGDSITLLYQYDRSGNLILVTAGATSATPEDAPPWPLAFQAANPAPNPLLAFTEIAYVLPDPVVVDLAIFDVSGRLVRTLARELQAEGRHRVAWDGRDDGGRPVAGGIYFSRLQAGPHRRTGRIVVLR
jgi:YD repeat-containing protein